MHTRLSIILSCLGICALAGCGGSSKEDVMALPAGLARSVTFTLPEDVEDPDEIAPGGAYAFGFQITGNFNCIISDGKSQTDTNASYQAVKYNPADDTCEQITFNWTIVRNGETTSLPSHIQLRGITNVSRGTGTIEEPRILYDAYFGENVLGQNGKIDAFKL